GGNGCGMANRGDDITTSARLGPKNAKAVLRVVVGDAFDETSQHFRSRGFRLRLHVHSRIIGFLLSNQTWSGCRLLTGQLPAPSGSAVWPRAGASWRRAVGSPTRDGGIDQSDVTHSTWLSQRTHRHAAVGSLASEMPHAPQ